MTTNNQRATNEMERTVPIDTDSSADVPQAEFDDAPAHGDIAADIDERTDVCDEAEAADEGDQFEAAEDPAERAGRFSAKRILACALLPVLALILAAGAAYLRWQVSSAQLSRTAAVQSTQAATESTVAMLSYRPETVDKDLLSAGNRMTGKFRDDYTRLINDIVIPGAKQKKISAVAKVAAAASVSATENHAVVLEFVDQTVTIGDDPPTDSASTVRITLEKVNGRWLISQFDPI
jgi:Mce-associated membrane protein